MRYSWCALVLPSLLLLSFPQSTAAGLVVSDPALVRRDEHGHMHHGAPLLQLNETEVTMYHDPTPESYYTIDWEDPEHAAERHPGMMMTHAALMSLAFFVALPAGIAMRSVNHAWHKMVMVAFYGLCALGCASSALYRKLTPNMYENNVHGKQGYWFLLLAVVLTTIDLLHIFRRIITFFRSGEKFQIRSFWRTAVLGQDGSFTGLEPEYAGLVTDEPEEMDEVKLPVSPPPHKRVHYENSDDDTAQWANDVRRHRHHFSQSGVSEATLFGTSHSDEALHDLDGKRNSPKVPLVRRIGTGTFAVLERVLVFGGYMQLISGIVVYTGGCRQNYINGCLAHLIKGGIFWSYGLVSFARYLGSFSELGWAWNRAPAGNYPSAEFVESLVIFLYGISNTWMERFGASPGDPFTTKQIQHIGIAVMFWFAGLLGMAIESKTVRRWLAASTLSASGSSRRSQESVTEPPSYIASFNPFPALVIGVTGAAMAAHAQTYLFQVQIHELWGNLLLSWSILRCLTYFFLWLGPPRSILPSRPPTEALGSFFLACGGLAFQFSTEEVTIAAMRRGRDDVMMFLNVAVAITCSALCWTVCVVAFKGYLKSRLNPQISYHSSA